MKLIRSRRIKAECHTFFILSFWHSKWKQRKLTIVSLLHDLVEDTEYSVEYLTEMGFDKTVTDATVLMTHDDGVEYMDYVRAIKVNPIAKAVKLDDLRYNSDLTRLDTVDEKVLKKEKNISRN